jgi:hypothetical protein
MPEPLSQLPYYREYVEQILRPRVAAMVEELRAGLGEQVWGLLLERMARDQRGATDAASLEKLRQTLTETLGLKLAVQLAAEFAGAPAAGPEVVERSFPNNPLARAVTGVRRA